MKHRKKMFECTKIKDETIILCVNTDLIADQQAYINKEAVWRNVFILKLMVYHISIRLNNLKIETLK